MSSSEVENTGVASRRAALVAWLFPDRLSRILGAFIASSLLVLTVTGVFLMFFYNPSVADTVYNGPYAPLRGVGVSKAYDSILNISFNVNGGLLMRQVHHWATLLLNAALLVFLVQRFIAGRFRGKHRVVWLSAFGMFVIGLGAGFTGYNLPDDLLSGTSMRIAEGVVLSIPLIGTRLYQLAFGEGGYPGDFVVKLYWVHITVIPLAIAGLIGFLVWKAKRLRVAKPDRAKAKRHGREMLGVGVLGAAMLTMMGAVMQIAPVWVFGPADSGSAANGSQPEWYMAFLDGGLRIFPNWDVTIFGNTLVLSVLVPALVIPGILFGSMVLVSILPNWFQLKRPLRISLAAGWLTFYGLLWIAGGGDIIAVNLHLRVEQLVWFLRVAVIVLPALVGLIAWYLVRGVGEQHLEDFETGTIIREPDGGFEEIEVPRQRKTELEGSK